ncbi:IclR family transcriptional regulator [Enteractinococcus coprophilus]|uniref:IclR family transcriptional regulator n=1 Tax=Enteractinococcus coprophilus TaxID=1027633 RepID=A0A543AGX2_9MICC|nr:IclR family transcriptional regulator [Enteractinococcus coprophilus]TQL71766.1 IclR family transcriptional regulator [Enteractinococcus coprophilus]
MSSGSSTLAKGLDLLRLMGQYPSGAPAAVFAKDSGLPFSTAYRLLNSLVASGFAEFDAATKQYRPGLVIFELSSKVASVRGYDGTILPVLQRLSETTNESCLFAVRDGLDTVTVHTVDGPEFRQTTDPGDRLPLHVSAMGKAILAGLPPHEADELIEQLTFAPRTAHTVSDAAALQRQIAHGREVGYLYQSEEVDLGMNAIGTPVVGSDGKVLGAVVIAAPLFRATKTGLVQHREALDVAAYQLAIALTTIQPRG